jgi:hypothetical protein
LELISYWALKTSLMLDRCSEASRQNIPSSEFKDLYVHKSVLPWKRLRSEIRQLPGTSMPALAVLLRPDSPEPLNEPLVRVIALVGEPDAGAQPQTAGVLACNDGADDWSPFALSDVR